MEWRGRVGHAGVPKGAKIGLVMIWRLDLVGALILLLCYLLNAWFLMLDCWFLNAWLLSYLARLAN